MLCLAGVLPVSGLYLATAAKRYKLSSCLRLYYMGYSDYCSKFPLFICVMGTSITRPAPVKNAAFTTASG